MRSTLKNQYAIVTGGAKGIGHAITERLLMDEISGIAILDYEEAAVKKAAQEMDPGGERLLPIACNVADQSQVEMAVQQTFNRFGAVHILVNNAGINRDAMFHKMDDEKWNAVMDVNLGGTYNLCKYIVPPMRAQNYGRIVNIASISAFGNVGHSNYTTSKAAIIGFTKALAKEGGLKNITANCIAPGYINTDMARNMPPEVLADYIRQIPLRRLGEPREIASVVSFLVSDDASYVSGECMIVSGGLRT